MSDSANLRDRGRLRRAPGGVLGVEHHGGETAAEALLRLRSSAAAIGWSPGWAGFIGTTPPKGVYELRAFDGEAEVRWYSEPGGATRTVVLRELPDSDTDSPHTLTYAERIDGGRMIVWGDGTDGLATRSRQVGELATPIDVPKDAHLTIEFVEYVRADERSGTAVVFEERLVGLLVEASARKES